MKIRDARRLRPSYQFDFKLKKILECSIVTHMREPLKTRVARRIDRKRGDAFLRSDFSDMGGYVQVGRALRQLVADGKLVKVGFGLYARAIKPSFSKVAVPTNGLETLKQALRRVGIRTVPTLLERDYSAGRTTQVPAGRVVGVTRRVRRKVGYNGFSLKFERAESSRT